MTTQTSWHPTASVEVLRLRAGMLARTRAFFERRQVMEVETPVLSAAGTTDVNIHSLSTRVAGQPGSLYLHTSPEFPMKRLLAAGSGDIYQIARVFRDGESGLLYSPGDVAGMVESVNKILNEEGLRNKKEFVNHKILDCMGDLYLAGYKIIGKIVCSQGGHKLTNQLLRKVFQQDENFSLIEITEKHLPNTFINKSHLRSIA